MLDELQDIIDNDTIILEKLKELSGGRDTENTINNDKTIRR